MRLGLIADVHANFHALDRVLDALATERLDGYVCAGDLVGYGPYPNECVERIASLGATCVAGNHDLIAISRMGCEGVGSTARESLAWTSRRLTAETARFLGALPLRARIGPLVVAHGSLESPQTYVWPELAQAELDRLATLEPPASALVLGHTHRAAARGSRRGALLVDGNGVVSLAEAETHLINPGSVGQSRERRPLARFAVLDLEDRSVDFRRIDYDHRSCRRALRERGLPTASYHRDPRGARARLGRMRSRVRRSLAPDARGRRVKRDDGGEPVEVSVLIPVRNEAPHIRSTVEAIRAQELDGRIELLFVDGDSDDDTRRILEGLGEQDDRIRVLRNPRRHTAAGLNVGLRHARGRYIARMDGHTLYPRRYLADGVARLKRGDVEWVAGPQVPHGVDKGSRRTALALRSWLGQGTSKRWGWRGRGAPEERPRERELDTGVFAGVWRRETLEEHGGWREGWPINQDSELAARFLERGQRIVSLPALAARYIPRSSLRDLARQYWRYGMYRAKTSRAHPGSLRAANLLPAGVLMTTVGSAAAPRPIRRVARVGLGAYLGAIATEAVRLGGEGARLLETPTLPPIFAVMHTSWGAGFLYGSLRFGPPLEAVARAVTGRTGAPAR